MMIPGTGKSALMLAVAIICMMAASLARADVSATVDRTRASTSDLITLTVRHSGTTTSERPDFSGLEQDFDIVDQSHRSSTSTTIANGRQTTERHVDWILTLRPKRQGELTIPAIQLGGERTQPITIESVAGSTTDQSRGNRVVFFETGVDTESTYVQAQILYTVKLYYTASISGDFPSPPKLEDAVIETVESEKRYESIINNRRYYVLEKRYAIFPQRSGELTIPGESFIGNRGRGGLFTQRERVSAASEPHTIEVKPRPDSFRGNYWLPARALELSETWSRNPPEFVVGEPVNRTLTVRARGVAASALPLFEELTLENAKTYRDPADTDTSVDRDGVVASRSVTVGIVPTEAGSLRLPEIRIPWWNTETDSPEVAVIPGATYEVKPGSTPLVRVPSEPVQVQETSGEPLQTGPTTPVWWQYVAAGLAALWLISTVQWLITRRDLKRLRQATGAGEADVPGSGPDESALFKAFSRACREGDPVATQQCLYRWAKARSPEIESLQDFARRAGEHRGRLETAIRELERALYAPGAAADTRWDGNALLSAVTDFRNSPPSHQKPATLTPALNP